MKTTIALMLILAGCAQAPVEKAEPKTWDQICALVIVGQTETGQAIVRMRCRMEGQR